MRERSFCKGKPILHLGPDSGASLVLAPEQLVPPNQISNLVLDSGLGWVFGLLARRFSKCSWTPDHAGLWHVSDNHLLFWTTSGTVCILGTSFEAAKAFVICCFSSSATSFFWFSAICCCWSDLPSPLLPRMMIQHLKRSILTFCPNEAWLIHYLHLCATFSLSPWLFSRRLEVRNLEILKHLEAGLLQRWNMND